MANIRRTQGGSFYVDLEWNGGLISDALKEEIEQGLSPVMADMESAASAAVHIGSGPRDPRPVYKKGKYAGKAWTSREPGRLQKTIRSSVRMRKDRTAIVGFLEAGDDMAYYAAMEEMEHPYLRPAFNTRAQRAIQAINDAVAKVAEEK